MKFIQTLLLTIDRFSSTQYGAEITNANVQFQANNPLESQKNLQLSSQTAKCSKMRVKKGEHPTAVLDAIELEGQYPRMTKLLRYRKVHVDNGY